MGIFKLHQPFAPAGDQPGAIASLVAGLEQKKRYQAIYSTPEQRFVRTKWQDPWLVKTDIQYLPDGKIQLRNIRDFRYHSEQDYNIRYKDMTLDLNELKHIDLAVSHWDGNDAIAHTMLIFHFSRWRTLVLSMETRIPQGQNQNGIAGLFKQYEIMPVIGTPEDLLDLRSKYRGEDLFIYRINTGPEENKLVFTAVINYLQQQPEFYNTLTRNCTTSLAPLLSVLGKEPLDDIRLLINGFSDKMMYQKGYLSHREGESFASLKSRSYIRGKNSGK